FLMLAEVVCDRRNQVLRSRNIGSRRLDRVERIDGTRHDGAPSLGGGLASRLSPHPFRVVSRLWSFTRRNPPPLYPTPTSLTRNLMVRSCAWSIGLGKAGKKEACLKRPAASALCYQESMSGEAIRIIGIDPGLRRTGWGVIDTDGVRLAFVSCGSVVSDDSEG